MKKFTVHILDIINFLLLRVEFLWMCGHTLVNPGKKGMAVRKVKVEH